VGFGAPQHFKHQCVIEIKIPTEDRLAAQSLINTDFGNGMAYG
jgi:hypothetical protein